MDTSKQEKMAIHNEIRSRDDGGRFWLPEGEIPLTYREFGQRLRDLRMIRGIGQARLAKAVGRTQQSYSKIENGRQKGIAKKDIPVYAGILGCTACYLAGYSDKLNGIKGGLTIPVMISSDGEIVDMTALLQGYRRDPELALLCIQMLKGSQEQRKHYARSVRRLLDIETLDPVENDEAEQLGCEKL